jgi:hypothetical protein
MSEAGFHVPSYGASEALSKSLGTAATMAR